MLDDCPYFVIRQPILLLVVGKGVGGWIGCLDLGQVEAVEPSLCTNPKHA